MGHKNRIGNLFSLTSFGESHGPAVGGVIDGMPAGVEIDLAKVQQELDRRRPGKGGVSSSRNEVDEVEILSGLKDGITLGTPIGFIIRNLDQRPYDYDHLENVYRPSHADYTYQAKYGIRDHRGGGRASARETIARVVAGAFAKQALNTMGITITAKSFDIEELRKNGISYLGGPSVDPPAKDETFGGLIMCTIHGVEPGLGEPVFGKLSAQLAEAMMSIPAAKGFDIGVGFDYIYYDGSEMLDNFVMKNGKITTITNHSGGIQGGISNGSDIWFKVAFKPIATLMQPVEGIDSEGNTVTIEPRGRHDTCVVPRALPIVEAMAAIVIFDNYLMNRAARL